MSDYICPYNCSYRTNSGFCGYTGGYDACQYRLIAQKRTIKRRIVYRGAVYNAIEAERIAYAIEKRRQKRIDEAYKEER